MANTELIEKFYDAFQRKDVDTMASCYHPEIEFSDPAFGTLAGNDASKMWRMLCQNGTDLIIEYSNIQCEGEKGSADWEAWYTFSRTGRKVHNKVRASFEFKDGLIIAHKDSFNLQKWATQAMGFTG